MLHKLTCGPIFMYKIVQILQPLIVALTDTIKNH